MSAVVSAAFRIMTEPMLAGAYDRAFPEDAVMINLNEDPLGPCDAAREAIASVTPQGGRYLVSLTRRTGRHFCRPGRLEL